MDEKTIRSYAQLMREFELTGLEIRENDSVVRLERRPAPVAVTAAAPAPAAPAPVPQSPESAAPVAAHACAARGGIEVRSPMVGVFYCAPAENADPYVRVGDHVHKGDVLCIIEAMKLMNEISAEQDGIITEICVNNGQVVDFGCPLFRMERESV